jgi:hypothetical protein
LNDRQYEALGCIVSETSGASRIHLTPAGNEGGIDFIAALPLPGKSHVFRGNNHPVRIVGQCKKYASPVSLDRIRDFAHTLNEVRDHNAEICRVVPAWFWDMRGPIVGWHIAHTGHQSGVTSKAKHQGIILSDAIDMAEAISHSNAYSYSVAGSDIAVSIANRAEQCISTS